MKQFLALFGSSIIFFSASIVAAQSPAPAPSPHRPSPRDLFIQESTNGVEFAKSRLFVKGGVAPCAVRDGKGRLIAIFEWFSLDKTNAFDRVALVSSSDDGPTWTKPEPTVLRGLPGGYQSPRGPTLVLLEDGKLRLYFTSCATFRSKQQMIYSALSSDGVHYVFEPGMRFGIEDGKTSVSDCAVARLGKTFHLYAPVPGEKGRGYHAVSSDGLKFQRQADVIIPAPREWLGNVVTYRDGLGFYGSSRDGLWVAFSRDGIAWQLNPHNGERGEDPAVVLAKNGRLWRIYTGGSRANEGKQKPPLTIAPGSLR